MQVLNSQEIQSINGGVLPLVIVAGKAFAAGFGLGAAAFGLYFSVK